MLLKIILSGIICLASTVQAADKYKNYSELSEFERENVDYKISVLDRKCSTLLLAIHGGAIEPETSQMAKAIALGDYSLYLFEGMKNSQNNALHLTSHHFDEPRALELVARSKYCVSIHGFRDLEHSTVCVGGSNLKMKDAVAKALLTSGLAIDVQTSCDRLRGQEPLNIVNRCQEQGVQLEISTVLRQRFQQMPALEAEFAGVIRGVLQLFQ